MANWIDPDETAHFKPSRDLQSFQSTRLKGLNIYTCVNENNIPQQSKQDSRTRIQPCAHTHTHTHDHTYTLTTH